MNERLANVKSNSCVSRLGIHLAVAACLVAAAVLAATTQASAQVRPGEIVPLTLNFGDGGFLETEPYRNFLGNLREAASVPSPDGVLRTQGDTLGLISVRADQEWRGCNLTLWFQPSTLYLLGYQHDHKLYVFNDLSGPLQRMNPTLLGFDSSYGALEKASGTKRANLNLSHAAIQASMATLCKGVIGRQEAAKSLMLLVQLTSEAARFNEVEDFFARAISWGPDEFLPPSLQEIENKWSALSKFYFQKSSGGNPAPIFITDIGNVTTAEMVLAHVAILLGSARPTRDKRFIESAP